MNTEKWNEICFLLSENIKQEISESLFEQNVIQALRVLGWKEYLGDFDIRPSFQVGAANRITPDFVIKSKEKLKLFVIEIKQPNIPISLKFQQQLFSYMRQLKLEYGILIGEGIQIFYDGESVKQEDPVLLETIKLERNNLRGENFVQIFSKESYSIEALRDFSLQSLEKINRREDFKKLSKKILSENCKQNVFLLIKQEFLNEYDGELIDSVLKEIEIDIYKKSEYLLKPLIQEESFHFRENKTNRTKSGVISSIANVITTEPKTQDEILAGLVKLFPNRSEDSMRNTVKAQLGGSIQPLRIEKERRITLIITIGADNIKRYSIKEPIYTNAILPIELNPQNEAEFKRRLLIERKAFIITFFENGTTQKKVWNANRFAETSGVLGNLRSRPEFRNGEWQKRGIIKVFVSIEE